MKPEGRFIWDEHKRESNLVKHEIDFVDAATIFDDPFLFQREDKRRDYGERRFHAVGFGQDKLMLVVYTWRGGMRRLISARVANRKERRTYEKAKASARKPHGLGES
jgi:uncharacterized DUF497 family protein